MFYHFSIRFAVKVLYLVRNYPFAIERNHRPDKTYEQFLSTRRKIITRANFQIRNISFVFNPNVFVIDVKMILHAYEYLHYAGVVEKITGDTFRNVE